jgi:hypothetical protein
VKRWWPLTVALLGGCAAIRSLFPEPYPYRVTPGAVKVPGPAARAVGVAFGDFVAQQTAQRNAVIQPDPDAGFEGLSAEEIERDKPMWDCMDSPGFYDTWYSLEDGGTRYRIEIFPKPEVCGGTDFYGGGAVYEIDAKDFTILKRELGE